MGEIKVSNKQVVIPGEVLAEGMDYVPTGSAYREEDKILSMQTGLVEVSNRVIKVIPLSGPYFPREGDTIIGRISDVLLSGWRVEMNTAYEAILPVKDAVNEFVGRGADLSKFFDIGDLIFCSVSRVTSQMLIDLSMKDRNSRKLFGGRLLGIAPVKIPRVIGKKASMVAMLKNATGCKVYVGKNGLIWIDGDPKMEQVLVKALQMIDEQAHTSGLTERVKKFLEKETGNKIGDNDELQQKN
ncbi:MAG TPA: RNA-binding protein [Candidatus Woesearchaeota archaeon]|nr:RNA-binding protein [Candidatus Woesearchaeota archaeon]